VYVLVDTRFPTREVQRQATRPRLQTHSQRTIVHEHNSTQYQSDLKTAGLLDFIKLLLAQIVRLFVPFIIELLLVGPCRWAISDRCFSTGGL